MYFFWSNHMHHTRQIIFLLLFISNSLLLIGDSAQNGGSDESIKTNPLHKSKVICDFIKNQQMQKQAQSSDFTAMDIEEMKLVFKSSPKEAQLIVDHLQDPTFFPLSEGYRSALFVGEPGSGKTTMARAIGYKMAAHGWEYKFLLSTSLLGEHRNHTAIRLQKELEAIAVSKKATILIIDELNLLLENADSEHHDTDATSTALWTFLDKQKNNKNFFFIGTTNRVNKLPKPCKSRFFLDSITFPLVHDFKVRSKLIRKHLTNGKTILDEEVTDDFLDKEIEKIGSCSGRDLEKISGVICRESKRAQSAQVPVTVIKKAAIAHAVNHYMLKRMEFDYDAKEETDEQRQNRFHKENLEMQERHFIQQHMIQMAINNNQYVKTDHGTNRHYISAEGEECIAALISDEQKQLYNDMMQKTHARRAQEAADKAAAEKVLREAAQKKAEEDAKKWFWERK